jgi:hypothetical protein
MDLFCLDDLLWITTDATGLNVYDFEFGLYYQCRRPLYRPQSIEAVARLGAFDDYEVTYTRFLNDGIRLVHTPENYFRCTDIRGWYPLISDLTARTLVFDDWPSSEAIERELEWPIFVKGARQTSRHRISPNCSRAGNPVFASATMVRGSAGPPPSAISRAATRSFSPGESIRSSSTQSSACGLSRSSS